MAGKPETYEGVYVEWWDAEACGGWEKIDDVRKDTLPVIKTLGWLVREDDEMLVIAAAFSEDEINVYLKIPTLWVKSVHCARKGKKR